MELNKAKIIMIAIATVMLIAVAVLVVRFIQTTIFSATQELQKLGEAPIEEVQDDEVWTPGDVASEDDFDVNDGLGSVVSDSEDDENPDIFDEDDDVQSVPVEETADELADTVSSSLPVDDGSLIDDIAPDDETAQ